ncbi:MAG: site-specific integrase [Mesorhizobium sp.]|uniref:tyrosine-type recombinase/integrase n=1 Tax=unclassified Mesorhizobium TaxID=325217 RepID=UPI000F75337C|nr:MULTISPECIES: site-specific integrase [unclassified Mesorhizobium]AZO75010.1 site-specific integrase [Mesorhizobium sp. M1D.F.Ca.ET.043.01.1.1]RWA96119.1 MAG: site-specific integrase [Mesorhizobium sp.]TJW90398.1 MAG: site-specific integrase [Mesorhizobium sp.]
MAKRVRDATLDSKEARAKLKPRGKPYYKSIGPGLHVGYRKGKEAGRWVVRMYVGDQDYRVETIADADDKLDANGGSILTFWQAQDKAREVHKAMSGESGKVAGAYTVKEAVEDYLQWMEGARKSSKDARYRAEALILPEIGDTDVSKLTAKQIRKWHSDVAKTAPRLRTKAGKEQRFKVIEDDAESIRQRRATANRVLTILKAALNYAWREGKAASDREWRRVEPFEDVESARVHYLTIVEAQRLVNASSGAFRDLVQAALQTGARYSELARLRVEDFNSDVGTLTIRASKSGKGRHIVLTDEGSELFKQLSRGKQHGQLMLTTPAGGVWEKSHQFRPMKEACKNGKIVPAIGFHGLRHTWASLSVMNGMPLMVVAKNLGHSDTRMVEKHYGHLSPSYVADAVRASAPRFQTVEKSNVADIQQA